MVKNYVVGSVRPVIKSWYPGHGSTAKDNEHSELHWQLYREMYDLSRASARRFLAGEWDTVLFDAPVLDARMFQIAQWYLIKELWHREPCNILSITADVMFVKPVEIFGQFTDMRLFNHTDPKLHADLVGYADHKGHYFNDAMVYFPSTMLAQIWDLGERRQSDWFTHHQSTWDCGQLIHNHMFWSQPLDLDRVVRPDLNWFMMFRSWTPDTIAQASRWNQCPYDLVRCVHFAGSRGAEATLLTMRELAAQIGVEV